MFADVKELASVLFLVNWQHGSVHVGQFFFIKVYSAVYNMECWVLLLQEVQSNPKAFDLAFSDYAHHEVMTATHNETG